MASFFAQCQGRAPAQHRPSTASVSSLSVSSIPSQDHIESQHTTQTSWSDRRTWIVHGKYVDDAESSDSLRAPSPLDPGYEDEDEAGSNRERAIGHRAWRELDTHPAPMTQRPQAHTQQTPEDDRPWMVNTLDDLELYRWRRPSEPIRGPGNGGGGAPIPSFPENFAKYFPSNYPISIYHPPTADGNMNLTLDIQTQDEPVTLFHMRMYHMKARDFALRRYCRESMRQVCKSTTKSSTGGHKTAKTGIKSVAKQGFRKLLGQGASGFGNWSGFTLKSKEKRRKEIEDMGAETVNPQIHKDSGYESDTMPSVESQTSKQERPSDPRDSVLSHMADEIDGENLNVTEEADPMLDLSDDEQDADDADSYLPKDTARLEFSNYSHLTIRRRTASKYEFEHWGSKYTWKVIQKTQTSPKVRRRHTIAEAAAGTAADDALQKTVEFHLYVEGRVGRIATIIPDELSKHDAALESDLGGWVPPSKLQILDEQTLMASNGAEVCDVIVATGLQALLDDCIRRRWDESKSKVSHLPGVRIISGIQWPRLSMSLLTPRKMSSAMDDTSPQGVSPGLKASATRRMSFGFPRRNTTPRSNPCAAAEESGEEARPMRRKSTPGHASFFATASAASRKQANRRFSEFQSSQAAKQESPQTLVKRGSPLRKLSLTAYAHA